MTDTVVIDVDALAIECPSCGMPPRHTCCASLGLGEAMGKPHVARVRDALVADRDRLATLLAERDAEIERLRAVHGTSVIADMIAHHQGVGCTSRGCLAMCDAALLVNSKWTFADEPHGRDWWCPRHTTKRGSHGG